MMPRRSGTVMGAEVRVEESFCQQSSLELFWKAN